MVYECYDQERGMPCVPPPRLPPVREHRKRAYLPGTDFLEVVSEKEALQRWLDDGGSSDHEVVSQEGGSRGGSIPLREEDVSSSNSKG